MTFSIPISKSRQSAQSHSAQWQIFVMLSVIMLDVTNKPFVLSVVRLNAIMLSVVALQGFSNPWNNKLEPLFLGTSLA